ncbi:MAG: hypothetical protein A2134_02260 [Candidatus Woykebacteria bacterium RBG_16_39_9b]|uniref:Uncharacterized protein n=1 Tax=Candidatus Woykebacteria bacterium RBG_16_39_9b TaxID=1802595 RepID=A0A1G1WC05_9BACT|nr:MAG: hypothetical protein A2134_02260 [Candidatus Woykebacteria bacterium RBG_16_39_9b]
MTNAIKIGLLVAIAIVFPLMVGLGAEAFYPSPKMSDECESTMSWQGSKEPSESEQAAVDKCNKDFEKEMQTYNRNIFIPITIIGFVALAAGALFISEAMGPVAPGLVFGGLFTILYSAGRGFTAVDKRWLFLELVVVLIGLILVTRRYLQVTAKESKK